MNQEWKFVYSEGHSMLMNEAFFLAFTDYPDVPGIFKTIFYENRNGLEVCYVPAPELARVKQQGKVFFDHRYRSNFQKAIATRADDFIARHKRFESLEIKKLSNRELLEIYLGYIKVLIPLLSYYQVSGGRCFPLLEERIRQVLAKYYRGKVLEKNYALALTPTTLDIIHREEIDLRKLSLKKTVSEQDLRIHAKKYALLFFNEYNSREFFKYLKERIVRAKKAKLSPNQYLKAIQKEKTRIKKLQKQILAPITDTVTIALIDFLREQGRLRLEYKNYFFGAEYKFLELFLEIAARIKISVDSYMASYRIADTAAFLKNGKRLELVELEARKRTFVFYQNAGKKRFASGKTAEQLIAKILGKRGENRRQLTGIPASPGRATGKARIIQAKSFSQMKKDLERFKKGEILIAPMTQPNMIVVMEKAAAIVTNQGGMTSHAAVVSREFGIPCIVGTYDATTVFKTGDLLEVDAAKGIVRRKD